MTVAEESTSYPAVSAPVDRGGLGFGLQVEHGLDERHAPTTWRAIRSTAATITTR